MKQKTKNRLLSLVLILALVMPSAFAFAAEDKEANLVQVSKQEHFEDKAGDSQVAAFSEDTKISGCRHECIIEDCGYIPAVEESPCQSEDAECAHEGECGYAPAEPGAPCGHTHDESCGGLAVDTEITADEDEKNADDAEDTSDAVEPTGIIVDFSDIDPLNVAVDTPEEDLEFPGEVEATIKTEDGETKTIAVPVDEWVCAAEGGYQPDIDGALYEFTPNLVLPEGVSASNDIETPRLLIVVGTVGITPMSGTYGAFTVQGGVYDTDYTYVDSFKRLDILTDTALTISGTSTNNKIKIADGTTANITIENLHLDLRQLANTSIMEIGSNATLNLTVNGENTLKSGDNRAGINVPVGSTLNITANSTGKLQAIGGEYAAGIGGNQSSGSGKITISGGEITAIGEYAAGIGGGYTGDAGDITITGGIITATGGARGGGTGIGGGYEGNGGSVTITGGTVTATGGGSGAGIGGGYEGNGGSVTISGGTVNATGGIYSAGIGGGYGGNGGSVTISGGTVTATGGAGGAGIGGGNIVGGGFWWGTSGTLQITGGSVSRSGFDASLESTATSDDTTPVYLTTFTLKNGSTALNTATKITGGSVLGGSYGLNDVYTDENGKVFLWLPEFPTAGTVSLTASSKTFKNEAVTIAANDSNAYDLIAFMAVTDITGVPTTATAGSNLTLTGTVVPATATNKTIVWSVKNAGTTGAAISGSTLSTTAAGTVVVTATITNGATASTNYTKDFTIVVNPPNAQIPVFATQPASANYVVGDTATAMTVNATVTGGGTVTYEWFSNTSNSTTGGTSVGTGATFTPPTTAAGTSYYYVVATNTNLNNLTETATSNVATIVVKAQNAETPVIATQPASAKYGKDTAATALSVTASVSDGGNLSYEWFSNSSNSTTGGTSVGTSATFTPLTNTIGKTYYYVVITNTNSNAVNQTARITSTVAEIEVTEAINHDPIKKPDPNTPISLNSNLDVSFHGELANLQEIRLNGNKLNTVWSSDNSFLYIQWPGEAAGTYCGEIHSGSVVINLYEDYIKSLPNGTYTLTALFNDGGVSGSGELNFMIQHEEKTAETPTISTQPTGGKYTKDEAATPLLVEASVTDGGELSYQWYSNSSNSTDGGVAIIGATNASYTPSTTNIGTTYYYIEIMNTNDSFTNPTASITSKIAEIEVVERSEQEDTSGSENESGSNEENKETPEQTPASGTTNVPKTGDEGRSPLWWLMLLVPACGLAVSSGFAIKKRKAQIEE